MTSSTQRTTPYSPKNQRRRGVILSEAGWQKLLKAKVLYDAFGMRRALSELSEETLLDRRTISRILSRDVGVDRRTLHIFFAAFNLQLQPGDYSKLSEEKLPPQQPAVKLETVRQRILEDCRHLVALLGLKEDDQVVLSIKLVPHRSPQLELNLQRSLQDERLTAPSSTHLILLNKTS